MERLSSELLIVAGNTESFVVDDLLDFSNDDGQTTEDAAGFDSVPHSSSSPVSTVTLNDSSNSSDTSSFDLYVPSDDIAELEWLSNLLVEETFSTEDQEKLHFLSGRKTPQTTGLIQTHLIKTEPEPEFDQFIDTTDESNVPVPAKARSKRSRSAASTWASRLLSLADESNPFKKQQRMIKEQDISVDIDGDCNGGGGGGRRCLHCATEKTPQWRTGPMGPKTLCNACGVRYKSGRLVPEYRPASSPTFVMARHSNSHRKVMELRRQKEMRDDHLLRCDNLPMDIRSNGPDFFTHNFNNHVASDFRHLI